MAPTKDMWEDIHSDWSFRIPSPALDEFREEYSISVKSYKFEKVSFVSSNLRKNEMEQIATGPPHPAYSYYYHEDSRILELVKARLPHFLPLFCVNNQGLKQHSAYRIDYMFQCVNYDRFDVYFC
ncbi:OLC1v1022719C1 [Oldenlandia corymbosa var. corymbosa]|uniref:OLC1v1022719C1 n=1 Tax=Oldenlandia corymbosa var. corymbosa TaxID=529605 RepID=A0AAV1C1B6_OLDCO|nr:OLC1v1022719C1 [Oldenlandia corymbosa var. corymbosa]